MSEVLYVIRIMGCGRYASVRYVSENGICESLVDARKYNSASIAQVDLSTLASIFNGVRSDGKATVEVVAVKSFTDYKEVE